VAESQRERLLAAVALVVAERGYRDMTITEIAKRASVANRVFYANFPDKEQAFLAAFDAVHDHLAELIATAVAAEEGWPQRVIAALATAVEFFAEEPELARLAVLAPFTATPATVARIREVIAAAAPYLREGRAERPEAAELPESTEESILGGTITMTAHSIFAGERELAALLPDLIEFVLSPYLGSERARELAGEAQGREK
jgi:AcrR family transcriptional regulator